MAFTQISMPGFQGQPPPWRRRRRRWRWRWRFRRRGPWWYGDWYDRW
ncbi:hypothetical protein [Nonomuraea helvata]|uniref:Uncharacterized protein n=1 Tax=Nonomuraea helvata TaxID=37484 RepID=A0ABV5SGE9_9ACTN